MKNNIFFKIAVFVLPALVLGTSAKAQISSKSETKFSEYYTGYVIQNRTPRVTDNNNTTAHELTAQHTKSVGANQTLGFSTYYTPNNNAVAISNSPIGVYKQFNYFLRTGSDNGGTWLTEGVDGIVELRVEAVFIPTSSSNPKVTLDFYVEDGVWNDNDFIKVVVENENDSNDKTEKINTTGVSQNSYYGLNNLTINLTQFKGKSVVLKVSMKTDREFRLGCGVNCHNTRSIAVDNIQFSDETKVFTGSGDFSDVTKWNDGSVPPNGSDVVIGQNAAALLDQNATINNLTLEPGAILNTDGKNLTVNGTVTVKGTSSDDNWHLYGTPVVTNFSAINGSNTLVQNSTNTKLGLATYNNTLVSPYQYALVSSPGTSNLNGGVGFTAKLDTANNLVMQGDPRDNNADYTVSITMSGGTKNSDKNFNLLGNPYLTHLNYGQFLTDNASLLEEQTIWVYKNGNSTNTGKYAGVFPKNLSNASAPDNLAIAQGFFIKAKQAGSVVFKPTQKASANATFLRAEKNSSIILDLKDSNKATYTELYFSDNKTDDFDNGYDSSSFNDTSDFGIYSAMLGDNTKKLAIQTVGREFDKVFPIGLNAEKGEQISVGANFTNFPTDVELILEDRLQNTFTSLRNGQKFVTVLTNKTKGLGRFYLHIRSEALSVSDKELEKVFVRATNNELYISNLKSDITKVKLFDVSGRLVFVKNKVSNGTTKISLPSLETGVYIVKVNSVVGNFTKKIILKK